MAPVHGRSAARAGFGNNRNGSQNASPLFGSAGPRAAFIEAIRAAGIAIVEPERIVGGGRFARFHVDGDKRGTRHGWAVLFIDTRGAGGAFGHWRTNISQTWSYRHRGLGAADYRYLRKAMDATRRRRDEERRLLHAAAQRRATDIWTTAARASTRHPYLLRKRVRSHGIRQLGDLLVVPVQDIEGRLWSVEFIARDGTKRFLKEGRKKGCMFLLGLIADEVLICEGYATGASLYEATGMPTVIAFDASNLESVARAVRNKYPEVEITICADNDAHTKGNPGVTKATAAALAVGARVAIPPIEGYDFNDMANAGGAK